MMEIEIAWPYKPFHPEFISNCYDGIDQENYADGKNIRLRRIHGLLASIQPGQTIDIMSKNLNIAQMNLRKGHRYYVPKKSDIEWFRKNFPGMENPESPHWDFVSGEFIKIGSSRDEYKYLTVPELMAWYDKMSLMNSNNTPLENLNHNADTSTIFYRLMTYLISKMYDFSEMKKVLDDKTSSVNDKLIAMEKFEGLNNTTSKEFAVILGVSESNIRNSSWWKENRGEKNKKSARMKYQRKNVQSNDDD